MFQIPRNTEFNFRAWALVPQDIATGGNLEINLTLMSISDENQIFYVGFNQSIPAIGNDDVEAFYLVDVGSLVQTLGAMIAAWWGFCASLIIALLIVKKPMLIEKNAYNLCLNLEQNLKNQKIPI